eukprot:scaffold129221_cov28-Tisochrysis_lutea.AAC.4
MALGAHVLEPGPRLTALLVVSWRRWWPDHGRLVYGRQQGRHVWPRQLFYGVADEVMPNLARGEVCLHLSGNAFESMVVRVQDGAGLRTAVQSSVLEAEVRRDLPVPFAAHMVEERRPLARHDCVQRLVAQVADPTQLAAAIGVER